MGIPRIYVALDVLLDDGRLELFWHYELEEIDENTSQPGAKRA